MCNKYNLSSQPYNTTHRHKMVPSRSGIVLGERHKGCFSAKDRDEEGECLCLFESIDPYVVCHTFVVTQQWYRCSGWIFFYSTPAASKTSGS